MFDVTVVSPWPRGLYLSKKFQDSGKKVCYIETPSENNQPISLFLNEEEHLKSFLLSQGFLEKQEGGFCLVNEQGVWSFQETDPIESYHPALSHYRQGKKSGIFKEDWLNFFACSYKSRLFEYNNALFSGQPLNLFWDYFLFQPSVEKKRQFQKENPSLCWLKVKTSELKIQNNDIFIKDSVHHSGKVFVFHQPSYELCLPEWQWDHIVFHGNLKDYDEIIPPHFVMINRFQLPWTHSNLLSVFKKREEWDVWFRRPFHTNYTEREKLKTKISRYMESFFKIPFHFIKEGEEKGFTVYGKESLNTLKRDYPFLIRWQEDLAQQFQEEEDIFQSESSF